MSPAKPETVNSAKKAAAGMRLKATGGSRPDSLGPGASFWVVLGVVAGDLGRIHGVDLLGVEELLRVAHVHLVAHEDVEEVGIDVAADLHLAQDRERVGQGLARLVRAVLGGQG